MPFANLLSFVFINLKESYDTTMTSRPQSLMLRGTFNEKRSMILVEAVAATARFIPHDAVVDVKLELLECRSHYDC
jgi:hypothetical protein